MFIRFALLVILIAIVGIFTLYTIFKSFDNRRHKKQVARAVSQADDKERQIWSAAQNVQELISAYTKMVLKHGPDSEESQVFRFGVENRELSSDNEALEAFNRIADIIRYNVKQSQKG